MDRIGSNRINGIYRVFDVYDAEAEAARKRKEAEAEGGGGEEEEK